MSIIYKNELSNDRDFLFESHYKKFFDHDDDVFAHVMNVFFHFVQIKNINIQSIIFSRRDKFDIVVKYNQQNCYMISSKEIFKIVCD